MFFVHVIDTECNLQSRTARNKEYLDNGTAKVANIPSRDALITVCRENNEFLIRILRISNVECLKLVRVMPCSDISC